MYSTPWVSTPGRDTSTIHCALHKDYKSVGVPKKEQIIPWVSNISPLACFFFFSLILIRRKTVQVWTEKDSKRLFQQEIVIIFTILQYLLEAVNNEKIKIKEMMEKFSRAIKYTSWLYEGDTIPIPVRWMPICTLNQLNYF